MKTLIQHLLGFSLLFPLWANADATKAWQMDGFATIGVQQVNQSNVRFGANTKNEPDWVSGSVLGLQGNYKLSPDWSITGQFLVRPDESDLTRLAPKVEWLFASYRLNDEVQLRAGQLRLPLYMYSEKLNVGMAYPMASLPAQVYGSSPINAYRGVDLLWQFELAEDHELLIQPYAGAVEMDFLVNKLQNQYQNVSVQDIRGLNLQWSAWGEKFKLRAGMMRSDLFYPGFPQFELTLKTLGASYQHNGWLLLSEASQVAYDLPGTTTTNNCYALVGKRLGAWFPYVSYGTQASAESFYGRLDMTAMTLGSGYQLTQSSSLKLEYAQYVLGSKHTASGSSLLIDNTTGAALNNRSADMIRVSYNLLF